MFSGLDIEKMITIYVVPWSINIALAIVVFIVGRLVAKVLVKVLERALRNAKVDSMLVEFIGSIASEKASFVDLPHSDAPLFLLCGTANRAFATVELYRNACR